MNNKQKAFLYLAHLLVYSDGEYDEAEKDAILRICEIEGISIEEYQQFHLESLDLSEREIFDNGVNLLEECNDDEKIAVFVWLYKMSEVDGTVHAKEIRFLLYSLRRARLDLDIIEKAAKTAPAIFL